AAAAARSVEALLDPFLHPFNVDHIAGALHPEIEYIDHRPLGFEPTRGAEQLLTRLRTLGAVATDIVVGVDDILSLQSNGPLVRWTQRGTAREGGGTFETTLLLLWVFGPDGLATHQENFPSDNEAEALARFDELTAAPSPAARRPGRTVRPNAATATAARIDAAIAGRDHEALAQLFSDPYELVDHVNRFSHDRHGTLAFCHGLMRVPGLVWQQEPLATPGDSLAGCRMLVMASGVARGSFDIGPYEGERISLVENDSTGRRRRTEVFGSDHLGAAVIRLYERFSDLLADRLHRDRAAATARAIAALVGSLDLERLAATIARDLAFVDHVTLGMGSVRGADAFLRGARSLLETSRDTAFRIDDVLGIRPDALFVRWTNFGTDRASGGAYERHRLVIWTFDADGLLSSWEQFDPDRDDEGLACFAELTGDATAVRSMATPSHVAGRRSRRVRLNAATANDAGIAAAMAARDGDALATLFAEGLENVEHPTGAVYHREGVLRGFRSLLTARDPQYRQ